MVESQTLSQVFDYKKGKPPKKSRYGGGSSAFYLTPEYLRGKNEPEKYTVDINSVLVKDGDIILLWDGSNAGEFFLGKKGILSSTMVVFDFKKKVDTKYVFYSLKHFEPILKSKTAGSGIPHVDKFILLSHEIDLYDLKEQSKIAEILSKIDEAIDSTEKIIKKNEKIKEGLMQDLFTKGIDEKGNIRSEETHEFKDSPLGRIPEEWDVKSIKEISIRVCVGFVGTCDPSYTNEEGIPMYRTTNIDHGKLRLSNLKYVIPEFHNKNKKSQLHSNDLIIARHGNSGECAIVEKGEIPANCLNIVIVRTNLEQFNPRLLNLFFNSYIIRNQISLMKGGSVQGVVNTKDIEKLLIPFIDKKEQEKLINIIDSIDNRLVNAITKLNKLCSTKKGLMQDLLSGDVRVTPLLEV